ncbi:hypothetical protein EDM57_21100 [Brevibacillus gelatini]|uniref:Uncharacterized protein n=1 Tax=Brevibacillus gelatini TaxID=1655277 RepID=A0A3M8APV4_9BACL|nr:hypothetical protein [Brevibacillus gelatini]RNB52687.1 hypothetical protein EDM57_21100 [Brevibacillus gelatini]
MADPKVTWRTSDNLSDLKQLAGGEDKVAWNLGTVQSNTESAPFRCLIWNNYGDANNDVSDMNDCVITTVDTNGGSNSPVVTGKWIYVKVISNSEVNYSRIGGNGINDGRMIKASGQPSGVISGARNNGDKAASTANFADVELKAVLGLNVQAGTHLFNLRVSYTFT